MEVWCRCFSAYMIQMDGSTAPGGHRFSAAGPKRESQPFDVAADVAVSDSDARQRINAPDDTDVTWCPLSGQISRRLNSSQRAAVETSADADTRRKLPSGPTRIPDRPRSGGER